MDKTNISPFGDTQAGVADATQAAVADDTPQARARDLYYQGYRVSEIARRLQVRASTVHSWKRRGKWEEADAITRIEYVTESRLNLLIAKESKSNADYKEIDALGRLLERQARIKRYQGTGREGDLNPAIAERNKGSTRKPAVQNAISEEQQRRMEEAFMDGLFGYQKHWYRAGLQERIRNLLKSRQIGATFYFAREALIDALKTGRNQIFLSASKAQAHQFKSYIQEFARTTADVELRGEKILLPNEAELIFLGTNSRTAQSYHGNLYLDEYFWIPKFRSLQTVASGMASQKMYRQTYFSTPSSLSHEAYPFWSGTAFNRGRPRSEHIELDVSHKALAGGRHCEDGQYRQIVTILDAEASGCDLFDIQQLRLEKSPDDFLQLFMCQFIDDGRSVFPLSLLQRCMVDSWEVWEDFRPFHARPFADRPVWIGYDPSHTGDSAGLVVIAPPVVAGGKFRVLDRMQFQGLDFEEQAKRIELLTHTYNVQHIAIDTTGLGQGVYQLVRQFFPMAVGLNYSPDLKVRMVLKALNIIERGRLEFDAGWTDLAAAFMAIKKTTTASGRQITFEAGRSEETSHADLAWACLHALLNEPLEGATTTNTGFMEIFG